METVLVTGASGFIGRRTLPLLLEKGYKVSATCRDVDPELQNLPVEWIKADLLKEKERAQVLEKAKPDILLHLAWYAKHGKFWNSVENFDWVSASIDIIKKFHEQGGRRAVMAGTCAEYDWTGNFNALKETTSPLAPSTPYGICKNAFRELTHSYSSISSLSYCWGRVFFIYGDGEPNAKLTPYIIGSILKGEAATIISGDKVRDFLYVNDVASAFVALLESDVEGPVNIGSGSGVSVKDLALMVARILKREDLVRFDDAPSSKSDPPILVADVTKLKNEIGWRPKYSLEDGLKTTIASMQIDE